MAQLSQSPFILRDILSRSIQTAGFPHWTKSFKLDKSEQYPNNDNKEEQETTRETFERCAETILKVRGLFETTTENAREELIEKYTHFMSARLTAMIYSSNRIEKAGLGVEETERLCERVFSGKDVEISDSAFAEEEEDEVHMQFLQEKNGIDNPTPKDLLRARREITHHAKALLFLLDQILNHTDIEEQLKEEWILETHCILCSGISLHPNTRNRHGTNKKEVNYAGVYRTTFAMAGSTIFTPPSLIGMEIKIFFSEFNDEFYTYLKPTSSSSHDTPLIPAPMDPFYTAADAAQDFVMIHPFADGNGRMSRLLLTALLVKYTGVPCVLGVDDKQRERYLAIMEEAGDGELEEVARARFAGLVLEGTGREVSSLERVLS